MDYVVGSVAGLISGNVTPNRPKLIRRALTPTKHPASPNVTPKSEFVEDRSIFLSPTQQKKKAIVKKSPKRIFENPDLDITEPSESSSPKADKVKKHLKDELEADEMGKPSLITKKSPSNKLNKSIQSVSPNKKSKLIDSQVDNESTPKKKKKKTESEVSDISKVDEMEIDQATTEVDKKDKKRLKKMQKLKSLADIDNVTVEPNEAAEKPIQTVTETGNSQEGKKKNKKRKKKNKQKPAISDTVPINDDKVIMTAEETTETNEDAEEIKTSAKSPKKKKNRKNKNKKAKSVVQESLAAEAEQDITSTTKDENDETEKPPKNYVQNQSDDENNDEGGDKTNDMDDDDDSDEEISNVANPNAITEQDTDSEHDSDDEIESENEEINKDALKTEDAVDSSDNEAEVKTKKGAKKKKKVAQKMKDKEGDKDISPEKEVDTEEVIKRTLFVGNVPFSNKCKKEIKKIFAEYGEIETVRIRTVPVKDGRVTPKLAVIRNEIHPDRSTVNVYVKFTDPNSVERALVANNTVLNEHHLRVSRSGSTGVEHDPRCAIFLGNLPFGIEDETLRAKFEKCGEIESVRIVRDKKTNAGKGFGYVNFTSKDGVELALMLSEEDLTVKNRIIRVKRCTHTLSNGSKNSKKSLRHGPRKDFGNNQGQNRNSGHNQGQRSFGNNQGPRSFGNNQGARSFGNNQGPNRNFGNQNRNQGPNRHFGNNQRQRLGNNQGHNRNFGNNQGPRNFGNNQNKFGNQGSDASGASRRIMNKRPHQESSDGPPNKKQNEIKPPREKKQKKEFVGMTGEKKKKQKFDKGLKKKKALSEILTKT